WSLLRYNKGWKAARVVTNTVPSSPISRVDGEDERMKEQFVIKHQDGDIVREVRSGSIRFRCDNGTWKVGLELKTCADYDPEGEEPGWDDDDPIIIHLLDYPVGEQDPRAEGQVEIKVPRGFDPEQSRYWTNLYFGEHFQPDNNLIRITKLPDD